MSLDNDLPTQTTHLNSLKLPIIVAAVLIVTFASGTGGYLLGKRTNQPPPPLSPSLSPRNSQQPLASPTIPQNDTDIEILSALPRWSTAIHWDAIKPDTISYLSDLNNGKPLLGFSRSGTITVATTEDFVKLHRVEDKEELKRRGWQQSGGLEAYGPGNAAWGYMKVQGAKQRVLYFNKKTSLQVRPEGGVEAECPCIWNVKVFYSDKF